MEYSMPAMMMTSAQNERFACAPDQERFTSRTAFDFFE
jgi:hypothetical protein